MNKTQFKKQIENLFGAIATRHKVKRPENFLSDTFDVEVYAVRQWTVRGVPKKFRGRFSKLCGISEDALAEVHGVRE